MAEYLIPPDMRQQVRTNDEVKSQMVKHAEDIKQLTTRLHGLEAALAKSNQSILKLAETLALLESKDGNRD